MAPELIAQVLNDACQDDKLNFQIVLQESIVHIYINRETDSELDYNQLINHITDSLITLDKSWEGFWLYSRIMGKIEPDWQTYVELPVDLSDNQADPLIEQTEDLIEEAQESLKRLKYLKDKDMMALEELDDAILNKNSFLLIMESAEEVDKSQGKTAEENLEDPFAVEELDDSILDKNSHLLAKESAEEVDNSNGYNQAEDTKDPFAVEELDDSVLDKNSDLLAQESAEEVDNSNGYNQVEDTEDPFAVEELDDSILDKNSDLLAQESADEIDNSNGGSPETDIEDPFAVEELDDSVLDKNSDLLAQKSAEEVDNSNGYNQVEDTEDPFAVEELEQQISEQESKSLEVESNNAEKDSHKNIEEDDIFAIEEIDEENINEKSNNLEINYDENIDNPEKTSTEKSNFAEYCFISNQALLENDLVVPKLNIAHLVSFFHDLSQDNQILLLPILNQHFKLQKVISETQKEQLSPEIQDWLQEIIELNTEQTRKAAIWFSRYCFNPQKIISEIQKVFDAEALKQAAENENEKTSFTINQEQNIKDNPEFTSVNDKKIQTIEQEAEKKQFSNYNLNLAVPIICLIVTFFFVILGFFLINSNSVDTEEQQSFLQEYYF